MMGLTISNLFLRLFGKKQVRILFVGFNGSGKTTILYKLKLGEIITTISTIGCNMEFVEYKNVSFAMLDVGRGDRIRPLSRHYSHYFRDTRGLIFVVDSSDREKIEEAGQELHEMLNRTELRDTTLLVFANKQDLPNAMNAAEMTEKLALKSLCNRQWHIQETCATQGQGLYEGLDWLSNQQKKNKNNHQFECQKNQSGGLNPVLGPPDVRSQGLIRIQTACRRIFSQIFDKKEMRILFVGLDAAGKTTILYQLKSGEIVTTIPTIGFNVETVEYKNISFTMWDVGGRDIIRPQWRHYFPDTQGLVFVVDSNDRDRVEEAREELHKMLNDDKLHDVQLLVFANKQDLPNAMNAAELTEKLALQSLRNRQWHIQESCATQDQGLYEGLDWLSNKKKKKSFLSSARNIPGQLKKLKKIKI